MAAQPESIVLERPAQELADATSKHPFLYEMEPAQARRVLDDLQAALVDKLPVDEEWITTVRYDGTVHDFMMLNSLSQSKATRAAIDQAVTFLREALGTAEAPETPQGDSLSSHRYERKGCRQGRVFLLLGGPWPSVLSVQNGQHAQCLQVDPHQRRGQAKRSHP
ncbi:hypothetical protein ACFWOT_25245 [Streptomyces sp. NPDC058440]|uniref:hypothetical protein n=1 Tax=Streptomyces sp. NPDC058440 TaxID=3346501 RepID=UPI00365FBACD